MAKEQSKAAKRRYNLGQFHTRYFAGDGIDIGGGPDPLGQYAGVFARMRSCRTWDKVDGDAMLMQGVEDSSYDFLHSSHCLEDLEDVNIAMKNWIRIVRPGGYLVITVPDEDMYEQGIWPSNYNRAHKWTFAVYKTRSWSPRSVNVLDLVTGFGDQVYLEKLEVVRDFFRAGLAERKIDQTRTTVCESCIEFILRKL
ncbi:methyltransferase domain-containing protein [Maridesulfovibrio sp.]|uniref:methyltransferase domain-containing protein n=1 Tax=Maridesulfovibrio sp. TaxID=2795000 RepID=UPI002A187E47|nr:methyltransferase domain-containing protein [Maridesulfovibrio sp.]